MAKKVKTSLDFEKNEIQNVKAQNLASAPASPAAGQFYYNTASTALYYYNGSVWVKCTETPSVSNVGIGATVYKGLNGSTLEFKSIQVKGAGLSSVSDTDNVIIELEPGEIDHQLLQNAGTKTHTDIDDHINSQSNPHSTTKVQVGLGSVDNVQQLPMSYLDTDSLLTSNSDVKVASQKAVKTYVDNKVTGVSWKPSVRAATTANITLSGTQTIDNVSVVAGDRVLVKNQSTASQNGIYIVAAGAWSRAADNDSAEEMLNATVMVREGTTNADTQWTCSTNAPITLNTTPLTFSQMSGAGTYAAGTGLTLTGNTFAISSSVVTLAGYQSLTNKTLTTPIIEQWIYDLNGVKILLLTPTAAAVNHLEILNNTTTNSPKLKAAGTDTNIDVDIVPKGTGRVKANNVTIPTISSTDTLTNKTIDAASNNISSIDVGNFKSGLLDTDTSLTANSDSKIATQKAVKTFAEAKANARAGYYKGTITAASTGTITAATHLCGTAPIVQVYEVSGGNAYLVEVDVAIATASGNVTWTAGVSFTGYIVIIGK